MNSAGSAVAVLSNNVDRLRDDGIDGSLDGLVVEYDGLGGCTQVPVHVQTSLHTVAVGITSVTVPADDDKTPSVVEVLYLIGANVAVGSTEASRNYTENLPQRILHQLDLLIELVVVELADVWMAPSMRADLVTALVRVSQNPDLFWLVDAAEVVTIDKEGSFLVAGIGERVDKLALPGVRTIIKCDGQTVVSSARGLDTVELCGSLAELVGRSSIACIKRVVG